MQNDVLNIGTMIEIKPESYYINLKLREIITENDVIYIHNSLVTKILNSVNLMNIPLVVFNDNMKKFTVNELKNNSENAIVLCPQNFDISMYYCSFNTVYHSHVKYITLHHDTNSDECIIPLLT